MADLKTLREQMANAATEARSLLDQANTIKDEARATELEAQHDKAMADFDAIQSKVERMERMEAIEQRALEANEAEQRAKRDAKRPGVDPAEVRQGGDIDYRNAFHQYLRAQGQKGDMTAEARAVLEAGFTPVEQRAQTTTAAAGGYTVPTELMNILVRSMAAWGPMYNEDVATVITTSGGNQITMPTVNDTTVTPVAHTEGATLTDTGAKDVVFGQKILGSFAYDTQWLRVSKELADDSIFAMEQLLGDLLGERLGRIANLQLTTGVGTTAPTGIVTASSLGNTTAAGLSITADEVIDLLHKVDPAYRTSPKAAFMFNDNTLSVIRKLKDGSGDYLWNMGNIQQGVPGSLLGYRYHINQAMPSIPGAAAATKIMLFGDFSKYYVRKVGAPLIGALQDKDFWPGFGVAGYVRFDGQLADAAAVKHMITKATA